MDPRDLAEIKSLAHKMGGKYVGIKGGRHTFDFPRDSAEDAKELADSLHDLGFEAYVDNGDVKIKESKVSAATKLIEFVKRGMNAQQAIDKALNERGSQAVANAAARAAKDVATRFGARGKSLDWEDVQDFIMKKDYGLDDQDDIDDFYSELMSKLETSGYSIG